MVLRAALRDLERAHQRGELAGPAPVPAGADTVKQAGAIGVAATGRVENRIRLDAGNADAIAAGVNLRTVAAERDDQRLDHGADLGQRLAGALAQQARFVVIDRAIGGEFQEVEQVLAVEHGQALTRIEDEGNARGMEVACVLEHGVAAVRRDDAETDVARVGDAIAVGLQHGARMEGGDLVVVEIGGNEGLGGEGAGQCAHVAALEAERLQTLHVGAAVVADGGHDHRLATEQLEVVGDIAGAAAEFAAHLGHVEADVEDVQLIRQQVVLEAVLEDHDVVVGDGSADQAFHRDVSVSRIE